MRRLVASRSRLMEWYLNAEASVTSSVRKVLTGLWRPAILRRRVGVRVLASLHPMLVHGLDDAWSGDSRAESRTVLLAGFPSLQVHCFFFCTEQSSPLGDAQYNGDSLAAHTGWTAQGVLLPGQYGSMVFSTMRSLARPWALSSGNLVPLSVFSSLLTTPRFLAAVLVDWVDVGFRDFTQTASKN